MAEVHIVDIDGEQWDIKDLPLTTRVATLENKISEMNTIRHDISQLPPQQTNNIWSCLMNQIQAIDWSFIAKEVCAYGKFVILSIAWGSYKAIRFSDNTLILSGMLAYGAEPHTFGAVFNPSGNRWYFNIDGEGLSYLQNNVLITYKMDRINNGFGIPTEVFVRNTAQTTIGNLYAALETNGLLNRPSTGMVCWDLQRQHNGVDLPKGRVGYPAYSTSGEYEFSGRFYFENPRITSRDQQSGMWLLNWSNGNSCCEANMWGEPLEGTLPLVTMTFVV